MIWDQRTGTGFPSSHTLFSSRYNTQLVALRRELKSCKSKLADQSKQNMEYATRMDEYDKKFEESARKFSTVLQVRKCSKNVSLLLLQF